jgi:hypothetical protein
MARNQRQLTSLSMSRLGLFVATLVCIWWPPAIVRAQVVGGGTGTIAGQVTDPSSTGLPGVNIAVASDALMVPLTTVTSDVGTYRVPALPPGTYTIVFTHARFTTVTRTDVRLLLGDSVTEDVTMQVAPMTESVTVSGRSSVLDRRSAAVGVTFDSDQLTWLPGPRGPAALMSLTPSVQMTRFDVGGSVPVQSQPPAIYGIAGRQGARLDGIAVFGYQGFGLTVDYGSFREVAITTAGASVDAGAPSGETQFLVKSGGNQYHASFYGAYEDRRWQAFNIDQSQLARDNPPAGAPLTRSANRLSGYHDLNADVGGFISKERAWWYASIRDQEVSVSVPTFPDPVGTRFRNVTTKVTIGLTRSSQLVGFVAASRNDQPTRLEGFLIPSPIHASAASAADHRGEGVMSKLEWRAVFGRAMFVEARIAHFGAGRREKPRSDAPRREDTVARTVEGGTRDWRQDVRRPQASVTATFFMDGPLGSHDLKTGVEVMRDLASETWHAAYPGGILYELRNGQGARVWLFSTPSHSEVGVWLYSAYLSDAWRVTDALSLALGVRFDRFRNFLPRQSHPAGFVPGADTFAANDNFADWNVVSPRLGVVQKLTRDGRTLLKASYATFPVRPGLAFSFNANKNSNQWWTRLGWADSNHDRLFTPDEFDGTSETRGGEEQELRDPDLKLPFMREAAGWIERELPGGVAIRSGVVWRADRRPFARQDLNRRFDDYSLSTIVRDPGPDGQFGTGDDGEDLTAYLLPPALALVPARNQVRNVAFGDTDHWTWEATALKRPGGRWSLMAAGSITWSRNHASAYDGQIVRQNAFPVSPNDFLHTDAQGRDRYAVWSARILATIDVPWRITVIPSVRHQSGQPFGRTLSEQLDRQPITILTEPIGTRRTDNLTIADLRLEKRFPAGGGGRLSIFLDVFNLLNANPEQSVTWLSGRDVNFLRPLSIVGPRIARVGLRLDW